MGILSRAGRGACLPVLEVLPPEVVREDVGERRFRLHVLVVNHSYQVVENELPVQRVEVDASR